MLQTQKSTANPCNPDCDSGVLLENDQLVTMAFLPAPEGQTPNVPSRRLGHQQADHEVASRGQHDDHHASRDRPSDDGAPHGDDQDDNDPHANHCEEMKTK